ncbi:MAG: hypothetical protein ACRD2C_09910 [Acidimicrobiales bacterium]
MAPPGDLFPVSGDKVFHDQHVPLLVVVLGACFGYTLLDTPGEHRAAAAASDAAWATRSQDRYGTCARCSRPLALALSGHLLLRMLGERS